jgi:alpha-L-fucosidase
LWRQPVVSELDWSVIRQIVQRLQPQTLLQLANGPPTKDSDARSVGHGTPVPTTESNVRTVSGAAAPIWVAAEAVYSIRADGLWFTNGETPLLSADQLIDLYVDTVGRNTTLLLNVPPDARGLFTDSAVGALGQFGLGVPALYRTNVAAGRFALADSVYGDDAQFGADAAVDGRLETAWVAGRSATTGRLEIDLGTERTFDLVSIREPVALGERATRHHVEVRQSGVWTTIASGTVIGRRKLHRLSAAVTGDRVALVVAEARGAPAVSELGLYDSATTRMSQHE